jgi:SAM-dependent methyltransferase
MSKSIDLGSGPNPKNPFNADDVLGVDLTRFNDNVICCDLGFQSLPIADASVDYVSAFDLIEHIPRTGGVGANRNPFIFLMNEIFRVLKINGQFYAQTPAYPYPTAFSDPTHVNFITPDTIKYFGKEVTGDGHIVEDDRFSLGQRYGFNGNFLILRNQTSQQYGHQVWLLRKIA